MENKITWSHSRINNLLNNPGEYYLNYVQGIQPKLEKTALSMGSAVHWGLENNTTDLTEYYNEKGSFRQWNNYDEEQVNAECMVEAFLRNKDKIFKDILTDPTTNTVVDLLEEQNELQLVGHLDSKVYKDGHDFLGIIDKLLLTSKGFILLDYKTSSRDVDWDSYISQLYKYKFLLNYNFPEIPLYKVGIINIKKSGIRQHKNENEESFRQRLKDEYLNNDTLIDYHIYEDKEFGDEQLSNYLDDLAGMLDVGQNILDNKLFFVNYTNIVGLYGKSQYYDIFYNTKDAYALYKIKDTVFSEEDNTILTERDCDPIDMLVLKNKKILNKYNIFKEETNKIFKNINKSGINKDEIFKILKKNYLCSDSLLEKYFTTYNKNI